MGTPIKEVRAILTQWCDDQQELYAIIVRHRDIQTISCRVTGVELDHAILKDSVVDVRLPLTGDIDAAVTTTADRIRSMTLTWPEGMSVFIVAR